MCLVRSLRHIRNAYRTVSYRSCSTLIDEAREALKSAGGGGEVTLSLNEDTGIARITLDQEVKRNAISGTMMLQLEEAVKKLEEWDTGKAVILQGAGDSFCSGGDLANLQQDKSFAPFMTSFMHNVVLRFHCLPLITVALVHGLALGGGAELTTIPDFRVFSNVGEIRFVQTVMGLSTGWGGGTFLTMLLGRKALDILLSAKTMNATEAISLGYANALVPANDRQSQTEQWLLERLKGHHSVIQSIKLAMVTSRKKHIEESLSNERLEFLKLWGQPANLEALSKKMKHK